VTLWPDRPDMVGMAWRGCFMACTAARDAGLALHPRDVPLVLRRPLFDQRAGAGLGVAPILYF